jgi:cytochrome c
LRVFLTLLVLLPGLCSTVQSAVDSAYQEDADKARALLHKAVSAYREQGETALAAFSRQGEFIDGQPMST